jgi:hypothetical protein
LKAPTSRLTALLRKPRVGALKGGELRTYVTTALLGSLSPFSSNCNEPVFR